MATLVRIGSPVIDTIAAGLSARRCCRVCARRVTAYALELSNDGGARDRDLCKSPKAALQIRSIFQAGGACDRAPGVYGSRLAPNAPM